MKKVFTPSFAKILSTPILFVLIVIIFEIINNTFLQNVNISVNTTELLIGVIFMVMIAYGISGLIWQKGRYNRKFLIVIFTIIGSIVLYFTGTLLIAFFGLCMSNLNLPCLSNAPCQEYVAPCAPDYILLVSCVVIFFCGIVLFIKEGKSSSKKSKK